MEMEGESIVLFVCAHFPYPLLYYNSSTIVVIEKVQY